MAKDNVKLKNKLIHVESSVVGFILIPLKAKYLVSRSHQDGHTHPRTGNSNGKNKVRRGFRCRRRAI